MVSWKTWNSDFWSILNIKLFNYIIVHSWSVEHASSFHLHSLLSICITNIIQIVNKWRCHWENTDTHTSLSLTGVVVFTVNQNNETYNTDCAEVCLKQIIMGLYLHKTHNSEDVSGPTGLFKEELLQCTTSNTRWCHRIRCDQSWFTPSLEEVPKHRDRISPLLLSHTN